MKLRHALTLRLLSLSILVLATPLSACGNGDESTASAPQPTLTEPVHLQTLEDVSVEVVTTDFVVGSNRFVFGLVSQAEKELITGAAPRIKFFYIDPFNGSYGFHSEVVPKEVTIDRQYTHQHADGVVESHAVGNITVYIARAEFDSDGNWAAQITGTHNGQELPTFVSVLSVHKVGMLDHMVYVGAQVPASIQPTLEDVDDLFEIDSSSLPDPHMHDMTIAEAVTSGRPTVIVFSTPGFCVSFMCGPIKEMVDRLYEEHGQQTNFLHVEPYDLEVARSGGGLEPVPVMKEWGLFTEPWVFMIDKEGKVAAKFEGIVSPAELDGALAPLLD